MTTHIITARAITQTFTVTLGKPNRIVVPAYTANDLVIKLIVVDDAGAAVDISTYTTRNFGVYPPASGSADITGTPAFVTDGTNGQITCTITDANTTAFVTGDKRLEVQISKTGAKHTIADGVIQFTESQI